MSNFFKKWICFFQYIFKRFNDVDCLMHASALTYTSLLAMVPLMVVCFNVLARISFFKAWGAQLEDFIFANFVPQASQVVQTYLKSFAAQATHLSLIGIGVLIITAILMIFTMESSFNTIWQVKERRHGVAAFFIYFLALVLLPILLGLSLALSSYVLSIPFVAKVITQLQVNQILLLCIPFIFTTGAFTFVYWAIPNCRVRLREAIFGGIIAAILFEIAKYGFSLYVEFFPSYKLIYGALAAIPIFLIWMYLSWLIILFGAILSNGLAMMRAKTASSPLTAI